MYMKHGKWYHDEFRSNIFQAFLIPTNGLLGKCRWVCHVLCWSRLPLSLGGRPTVELVRFRSCTASYCMLPIMQCLRLVFVQIQAVRDKIHSFHRKIEHLGPNTYSNRKPPTFTSLPPIHILPVYQTSQPSQRHKLYQLSSLLREIRLIDCRWTVVVCWHRISIFLPKRLTY